MEIYELRKTASKNKKYKHIYELIVKGKIVATRRSNKEYIGVWITGTGASVRYHWIKYSASVRVVASFGNGAEKPSLALTFEELVKYKKSSV